MAIIPLKKIIQLGGSSAQPWAGDLVLSEADFLADGRNLLPCDGSAIPTGLVAVGGSYADIDAGPENQSNGTISGNNWTSPSSSGFVSGKQFSPNAPCFVEFELAGFKSAYKASQWVGVAKGSNLLAVRDVAHTDWFQVNLNGTEYGRGSVGTGTVDVPPFSTGDLVAFVFDGVSNLTVYHNGVSAGSVDITGLGSTVFAGYQNGSGWTASYDITIRSNRSRDGYDYGVASEVGLFPDLASVWASNNLPDYSSTNLPYKVVAQNPETPGNPNYIHGA